MAPEDFTKPQQCTALVSRLRAAGSNSAGCSSETELGPFVIPVRLASGSSHFELVTLSGAAPQSSTSGSLWQEGDVGDEAGCTDEEFEQYCKAVEETAAWGGQIELGALAALLQRRIIVYSVGMPAVNMGPDNPGAFWTKLASSAPSLRACRRVVVTLVLRAF